MPADHRIVPCGDACVAVEFEERIDPAVHARVLALARAVSSRMPGGVRDVVPTYCTVAVHFDPVRTDLEALWDLLHVEAARASAATGNESRLVRIPVTYGGEHGPDLEHVARWAGLPESEVIERHTARRYRVYMLGFLPGFAYLGSVDPSIAAPRRATPRAHVPRGSVGIAGAQTGVYPSDSPGGWQIIGRTSIDLYDPGNPQPFLLDAGDAVEFYPV